MDLSGYIYDLQTGYGLPGASVLVSNDKGEPYTEGVAADADGYFHISNNLLDQGALLLISNVGYQSLLVNPNVVSYTGDIGMEPAADDLVTVVVTHIKKNPYWLLLIPFIGLIILLVMEGEKKRKITGVQLHANQWVDLAIKIGVPLILYFAVIQPILVKLGILKDAKDKAQDASDKEAQQEQQALSVWDDKVNHTYNRAQLDSIAVALRNDTVDWWGYQWRDIGKQLAYFTGLTAADARYLLGTFVDKNGYTLWQWFFQEFEDAVIVTPFDWDDIYWEPGWGGTGAPYDYRANYIKMGINESNANSYSWPQVVKKFVEYAYQVAGVAKQ